MKNIGWTVFIAECSDGTYYGGWTRDIVKELAEINVLKKGYFIRHPERTPVKVVFEDNNLPFREAFSKYSYLMEMNRRVRKSLIETKKWNNSWILYRNGKRSIPRIKGQR
jgi:putative endonuclease